MSISLQFLGAARQVTGSKHLLVVNERQILLECGMVQGPRKIANEANRHLGLEAKKVDAVVLSHAHIDHSGSLPRLVKLGFRGAVHCTEATKDLLEILLADSAHIQASDARYLRKKNRQYEPPFDHDDVDQTLKQTRAVPYYKSVEVCPGVTVEFLDAGHILGSAQVVLNVDDGSRTMRIVFTGDHGRKDLPILRDPDRLPDCDVLICESTYGNRLHESRPDIEKSLARIIADEMQDGGRILIPSFSVGRTQSVLLFLGNLMADGRIPRMPVYVDSPLSRRATLITARHREVYDQETQEIIRAGRDPFFFEGLRYVQDVAESMQLNGLRQGIIISASGMCEAGRILHHLKRTVGRKEDCVLAVGFMAQGTTGRKLIAGYDYIKIFGDRYRVKCQVRSIRGLSAHADQKELLHSLGHLAPKTKHVFVVHGEEDPALIFADCLRDAGFADVEVPVPREKFQLSP